MKNIPQHPILFFDGVCNLCNSSIQTIIKKDHQQKFKFASIQSDAAKEILLQSDEFNSDIDSIILKGVLNTLSQLRLVKKTGGRCVYLDRLS